MQLAQTCLPWVQSFDDVSGNDTNRGRIRVSKSNTLDTWHVFKVSGAVTDASGYSKVALTYIDGAGTLANNDKVFISFVASGEDGAIPGYFYKFDTGTSDADPGAGEIAFNNGTYASATVIYIDDADANGVTTQADTATWGDSTETIKGYLHIVDINDETTYARFKITASVVDASGYNKITVVHLASNNTFSAADELSVHFTRNGDAGASPGYFYKFDTGTSDTDPGAGEIAFNNGTYASATAIYIDDVDQNSVNTVTDVLTWDDSTSTIKGYLHIVDINDHTTYARFSITGSSTDASGYNKLAVTHIASNNTFSAADSLSVHFTRQGDKGDTGSTGAVGPAGAAGVSLTWETSTGDSDQGVGKMWGNNATFASISVLYIDDVDANSVNIEAWIQTLDDSTNSALRGTIYLEEAGTNSQFGVFSVTGACVDGTGYWKIPVSHVASNVGSLADGDSVGVVFSRTGNAGADGDGTFNNFTLTADSGSNQTVADGNTVDIAGGNSITTVVGATDTVTINADDGTASAKGAVIVAGTAPASVGYSSGTATISVADSTASVKGAVIVAGNAPASIGYSSGTATVSIADSAASTKGAVIVAGTSPVSVGYSSGTATVAVSDASTSAKGIASFASADFSVSSGAVSLEAAVPKTDEQNTFTKAQLPSTYTAALSATSGVLDYDTYQNFIITLASGSNTVAAPTTEASQIGQTGVIIFIQPSSSSAGTLSLHADYETAAAGGITLSTANNDYDVVPYFIKADNSILLGAPQLNFG